MPPPPLSPGGVVKTVGAWTFTLGGDISSFDSLAFRQALAALLGVPIEYIVLTANSAASIHVGVMIVYPSDGDQLLPGAQDGSSTSAPTNTTSGNSTLLNMLEHAFSTLSTMNATELSSVLNVTVVERTTPRVQVAAFDAPSPPPPLPPPPSPPPLRLDCALDYLTYAGPNPLNYSFGSDGSLGAELSAARDFMQLSSAENIACFIIGRHASQEGVSPQEWACADVATYHTMYEAHAAGEPRYGQNCTGASDKRMNGIYGDRLVDAHDVRVLLLARFRIPPYHQASLTDTTITHAPPSVNEQCDDHLAGGTNASRHVFQCDFEELGPSRRRELRGGKSRHVSFHCATPHGAWYRLEFEAPPGSISLLTSGLSDDAITQSQSSDGSVPCDQTAPSSGSAVHLASGDRTTAAVWWTAKQDNIQLLQHVPDERLTAMSLLLWSSRGEVCVRKGSSVADLRGGYLWDDDECASQPPPPLPPQWPPPSPPALPSPGHESEPSTGAPSSDATSTPSPITPAPPLHQEPHHQETSQVSNDAFGYWVALGVTLVLALLAAGICRIRRRSVRPHRPAPARMKYPSSPSKLRRVPRRKLWASLFSRPRMQQQEEHHHVRALPELSPACSQGCTPTPPLSSRTEQMKDDWDLGVASTPRPVLSTACLTARLAQIDPSTPRSGVRAAATNRVKSSLESADALTPRSGARAAQRNWLRSRVDRAERDDGAAVILQDGRLVRSRTYI